jgi:hypothetical protein
VNPEFEGRRQELLEDRPRPLVTAAKSLSWWLGLTGALIVSGTSFGLITAQQGDAMTGLLGLIPGAVTGVLSVLSAFGVVRRGEPVVTPLSDPRDALLRPLVTLNEGGKTLR